MKAFSVIFKLESIINSKSTPPGSFKGNLMKKVIEMIDMADKEYEELFKAKKMFQLVDVSVEEALKKAVPGTNSDELIQLLKDIKEYLKLYALK